MKTGIKKLLIVSTLLLWGSSTYVVTTDAISGPWSDPVDLKIGGNDQLAL